MLNEVKEALDWVLRIAGIIKLLQPILRKAIKKLHHRKRKPKSKR